MIAASVDKRPPSLVITFGLHGDGLPFLAWPRAPKNVTSKAKSPIKHQLRLATEHSLLRNLSKFPDVPENCNFTKMIV